jgi:peptidyl-tRNA hydrolase
MYLIEKNIGLSAGKGRAQCAHAAQKITEHFFCTTKTEEEKEAYKQWTEGCYTKIVLFCPENKWEELKKLSLRKVVIKDAGFTEIDPGTETVIGFWPILKSSAPNELKNLSTRQS